MIAIQSNIIEANENKVLNFVKVLDTYEEIDDGTSIDNETYDEQYWQDRAAWVLDTANFIRSELGEVLGESTLNYRKYYIGINVNNNNIFYLVKRSGGKVLLQFRVPPALMDDAKALLDEHNISYIHKRTTLV